MNRGLLLAGLVFATGCAGTRYYHPPPEQPPPPTVVEGTRVAIEDGRPEWERLPFTGAICLYHPGKARPSPWDQIARETEAVIAAMPRKPTEATIAVTSLRLVRVDEEALRQMDTRYHDALVPTGGLDILAAWLTDRVFGTPSGRAYRADLRDHPPGASCRIEANVRFLTTEGWAETVKVTTIAAVANESGTGYWGDALDAAAARAARQYGRQLREGVGLPPE